MRLECPICQEILVRAVTPCGHSMWGMLAALPAVALAAAAPPLPPPPPRLGS